MTEDECRSLESFARCLGVSFDWDFTSRGLVVFADRRRGRFPGFDRYQDAVRYLVQTPSTEQGWRESGMLN